MHVLCELSGQLLGGSSFGGISEKLVPMTSLLFVVFLCLSGRYVNEANAHHTRMGRQTKLNLQGVSEVGEVRGCDE